jgi:serine/threonine-protein kinase RsbW
VKETSLAGACLSVPAHVDSLAQVRGFVGSSANSLGLPESATDELLLAVDEAVSNIIMHGYAGRDGLIEVDMSADADAVTVRLRDDAPLFDPTGAAAPRLDISPLERDCPGGYGVELVRRLVDGLRYRVSAEGRNELILVKSLATESRASP